MIPMAIPDLSGNELKYLTECIETGWISSGGNFITKFEEMFAKFCECKYASSCSNGTAALHLALLAADIGEGDEVIVPDLTFASTASVVKHCHGTPVLVDVDDTWNLNPELIEEKITKKTKAIIAVHLYGNPCDMDKIMEIARKHNLVVIEDCAEAVGAKYKGKTVGSIGDIGCFSFFGNKIITTGEGGMCTSNNKELMHKLNNFKNHGMAAKRYWHDIVGYNYRMTNMQAAIGVAQMERIKEFLKKRNEIANTYKEALKDVKGIKFQEVLPNSEAVCWLFTFIIRGRDELMEELEKGGVDSRKVFYPLHTMPPFADDKPYPKSSFVSDNGISLPTHNGIADSDIRKITELIK